MVQIDGIDAAIHEAIAVRRADHGIAGDIENGTLMDGDTGKVAANVDPGFRQTRVRCRENDFHHQDQDSP